MKKYPNKKQLKMALLSASGIVTTGLITPISNKNNQNSSKAIITTTENKPSLLPKNMVVIIIKSK
jgi:hypothetical protein